MGVWGFSLNSAGARSGAAAAIEERQHPRAMSGQLGQLPAGEPPTPSKQAPEPEQGPGHPEQPEQPGLEPAQPEPEPATRKLNVLCLHGTIQNG